MKTIPQTFAAPSLTSSSRFKLPTGPASVYLDAIRGLAAFGVLVHHWQDIFSFGVPTGYSRLSANYWLHSLLGLGHQWVVVFFVMSGYLVGGTVLRSVSENRWSLGKYALTRGTRLYIVLIPALILGGLIDWSGMHLLKAGPLYSGQTSIASVHFDVAGRLHLSNFFQNVFFLQTLHIPFTRDVIPTFGSNGPLWSLAYEFWFYVGFPILVFALKPSTKLPMRLCWIALLLAWILFTGPAISVLWLIWLMGVALHFLPPLTFVHHRLSMSVGLALLLASILVLKAVHPIGEVAGAIYWTDFVFAVVVTIFLYALIQWKGRSVSKFPALFAQHAAASSYTLYLLHLPALILMRGLLDPPPSGVDGPFHLVPSLIAIAVVVAYAQLVYFLFERNTTKVRNWLASRMSKA